MPPVPYEMAQSPKEGRIPVPETIALSPIEDSFGFFEDLASLFTPDVTSPKTLTLLQSPSAMFSAGELNV